MTTSCFRRRRERPMTQLRDSSSAVLVALIAVVAVVAPFFVAWRFGPGEAGGPLDPGRPDGDGDSCPIPTGNPATVVTMHDQLTRERVRDRRDPREAALLRVDVKGGRDDHLGQDPPLSRPARRRVRREVEGRRPSRRRRAQGSPMASASRPGSPATSSLAVNGPYLHADRQGAVGRHGRHGRPARRARHAAEGDARSPSSRDPRHGRPAASARDRGASCCSGSSRTATRSSSPRRSIALGLELQRVRLVGDSGGGDRRTACARCASHAVVITSGGLGPTHDDRTVAAVADVSGRRARASTSPCARGSPRSWTSTPAGAAPIPPAEYVHGIEKQALVPRGAHIIFPVGTAPGLRRPVREDTTVVVLPGPPARARADVARWSS